MNERPVPSAVATELGLAETITSGRYASRVRIAAGAFAGMTGVVVRVHHAGAVEIRFAAGPIANRSLCFGPSELEVLS